MVITETKVIEVEKIVTVENKEAIEREKQLLRSVSTSVWNEDWGDDSSSCGRRMRHGYECQP